MCRDRRWPGNGAAFARRFDREGYAVALVARSEDFSRKLASELSEARAFAFELEARPFGETW